MTKMLSALVAASMLGLVGAAGAAEPVTLEDGAQLDTVRAGHFNIVLLGIAGESQGAVTGNCTTASCRSQ